MSGTKMTEAEMTGAEMTALEGEIFPDDSLVFASQGPQQHFFGYYDKSPLSRDGTRLLCLRTDCPKPLPEEDDRAEIGFFELPGGAYHRLAETAAFNWQQGAMLQWLGPDFTRRVIYNDRRDGRFVSIILDSESGAQTIIPFPVYTVHPGGESALSVDFERLYFPRRNYAYAGIANAAKDGDIIEGDGIFHVDFAAQSSRLVLSTRHMAETAPVASMVQGAQGAHILEHLAFNPSGRRFMFLHRWRLADGGIYTRLYSAAADGSGLRMLIDSGKVTHACWRGDGQILCWGALPLSLRGGLGGALAGLRRRAQAGAAVLKPLIALYHRMKYRPALARHLAGVSYLLIDDNDLPQRERFAAGIFPADGHPSWNPIFSQWLVTDTYEDSESFRWLYLYDSDTTQRIDFGKFFSPEAFNAPPGNCDLHPRWDFSGRYLSIDSGRSGLRQMYLFDVLKILAGED